MGMAPACTRGALSGFSFESVLNEGTLKPQPESFGVALGVLEVSCESPIPA